MMFSDIHIFLILGAFVGGFVNGLAGFGTALLALGFWLQIMPSLQAVALVLVDSCVTGLQGVWIVRHAIPAHWHTLMRFLLPAFAGMPAGLYCLHLIDPVTLKFLVALLMILYGAFFLFRRTLPNFSAPTPKADGFIGLVGGFLGGLAGLSGALPAMWLAMRPWPKDQTRAVLQPYSYVILLLSAGFLALRGAYTGQTILWFGTAAIVAIFGAQIGIFVYRRSNSLQFRWLLIIILFVSGLTLMLTEVMRAISL